jgi:hypothetical protein
VNIRETLGPLVQRRTKDENLELHALLLDNRQGKNFLYDGASTIVTEDKMRAYNRDNRGNKDINAPFNMNTMPMTVPFRAWNATRVGDYPPPNLRDKNWSDISTGNALVSTNAP